jgi:hypothetical protein
MTSQNAVPTVIPRSIPMPLLFSYGTLQLTGVQRETFGRELVGRPDRLVGFESVRIVIDDPAVIAASGRADHLNARFDGRASQGIDGTIFEVTERELVEADRYEAAAAYTRIAVTLASGDSAWVYVHAPSAPGSLASQP